MATTDVNYFAIGKDLFRGVVVARVKEYVKKNPEKKFRTWLIDEGHHVQGEIINTKG